MQLGDLYAYTGGKPFDPARLCVVFLHGAQHDHSVWILQSRALAHRGLAVLALDLPGQGRSAGPLEPSVEGIAGRVAAALAPLANPGFVLVGHSMGSLIALELAALLGPRVLGVALIGSAFPMRVSDALLAATRDDPAAAMQMINVWSHSASIAPFAPRPGAPGPGFNIVWQNLRLMQHIERRNGPDVLPTDFAACNAYAAGTERAAALACPALFVIGAADQMTPPKAARALIDACRDRSVVTLPATGHALMTENPDGVRRALERFADRLATGALPAPAA
ncbi:MAG: alpha/beta fold hydrolase [Betaproteobacteria bacterium]